MDTLPSSWFLHFAIFCALAVCSANAASIVSGTVFCDQCRDGHLSLYDYPLSGIKVAVTCPGSDGEGVIVGEETSNWFGSYSVKFDGTPDLSNCVAQVTGSNGDTHNCAASAGPPERLRAVFRLFGYAVYSADSLLSQPSQPMSFCPNSSPPSRPPPSTPTPVPDPVAPLPPLPPTVTFPPPVSFATPPPPPPLYKLPPVPGLPPLPPFPYTEASACPHQTWMMEQYKCYWRALNPDTKVALLFGPLAVERYGTDITMWQSLEGRGDPYRTLLREGTTAYLNSFNSILFPYNTLAVVAHMNSALAGSQNQVLLTALRFIRANGGYGGRTPCRFTPCK